MRLGMLTGGGDCPGLNAVIRAVVMRAVRTYDARVTGFLDGWRGFLGNRTLDLNLRAVAGILPRGGTLLGTSRVDPLREGGLEAVRASFARHQLDGLVICGGDGTLGAAAQLAGEGLPVVGIPKTIDNDVPGTEMACGFDTALATVVAAVDALHTTAESHDRVIVVEVMGRSTGWIAVCAGVAGGADVVVAPEDPMSVHEVCESIRHRRARGREFSIVVVAEGAEFAPDPDGSRVETPRGRDATGRPRYGGVGEVLAREIERRIGVEARTVVLGHVQRGGTPTPSDRLLGSRFGIAAVDLAVAGRYGRMVCLAGGEVSSVELSVVRGGARPVPAGLVEVARVFHG